MPTTSTIVTEVGPTKPWVAPIVAEVANRFGPLYYVWGYSSTGNGEHPKGRALDFGIKDKGKGPKSTWVDEPGPERRELGDQIAAYLWANRKRLNIWYLIWNRRIISMTYESSGWRKYSGSNPHTDHVHLSANSSGTYRPPAPQPPKPQPQQPPAPAPHIPALEDLMAGVLPAQLVRVKGHDSVYAVTLTGAIHIKNPTHLRYITEQGWVTEKVKEIPAKDLAELLEVEK